MVLFIVIMNYFVYVLLVGDDDVLCLGGMFGDFVCGVFDVVWLCEVVEGICLYCVIDVYIDVYFEVLVVKVCLVLLYCCYVGILFDMWFDYCLVCDFLCWLMVLL